MNARDPRSTPATQAPSLDPPAAAAPTAGAENDAAPSALGEERGVPAVNRVRSLQARVTGFLAGGLIALTALALLGWYYTRLGHRAPQGDRRLHRVTAAAAQTDSVLPPLGAIRPPFRSPSATHPEAASDATAPAGLATVLGPPPPLPAAGVVPVSIAGPTPSTAAAGMSRGSHRARGNLDLARRLGGAVSSLQAESRPTRATPPGEPSAATPSNTDASAAAFDAAVGGRMEGAAAMQTADHSGGSGEALRTLLTAQVTPAVAARVLPTRRFLIPKGAFIDCTLETAIDSTLPGLTTCVTATDTFGADGEVVLLERGTRLVGETRGQAQQGQSRLFVLWTEARTPTGVVIPLASPGTDALGRSGLTGEVDRHFFQRFGAALLISLIDIGAQRAAQPSGGSTVVLNPTTSGEILTEILRGTINIPPTLRIAQGERIQVLVARDLDFRSVYALRPVGAAEGHTP